MKSPSLLFPVILALVVAVSQTVSAQTEKWSGSCEVTFSGASTLHDFSGKVTSEPFTVAVSGFDEPTSARVTCKVIVKAKGMDTGNEKRDEAMYKSLDVVTYPEIVVDISELKAAETQPVTDGNLPRPTVIPFTMSLKGKTHQLNGSVSDWTYDGRTVACTVSFPVSLNDSGVKPPSVLGVVKVKDEIKVSAHLRLKRP